MYNPFRPDFRVVVPGAVVPRIDAGGIFVLATTGKASVEEVSLDYGINPCQWNALPNEGILLWKVRHPATDNEDYLAVNVVVPTSAASTVTSSNSTAGTTKIPVVDNKGTQAEGGDVTNPVSSGGSEGSPLGSFTEHLVYFNKSSGIFRLLGVKAQNSPSRSGSQDSSDTPTAPSAQKASANGK